MFSKVLVANRGEVAIRVMRTLEEMGVAAVGVYSEADRDALHARRAPESYLIGPGAPADSYLSIERMIDAAVRSGAEAVHPGYGFLAENPGLARACAAAGLVWIGPPPEAMELMGTKTRAREVMAAAGVPIVPGTTAPVASVDEAAEIARETTGYPVAVKAAGGGGGKGFRVAHSADDLAAAFEGAAREGERYFADATVYLERYLPDPRHVEVQVLADAHGNVIHLGERDCSVQRRHQKLVEESPAPSIDAAMRERIGSIGVEAARAVGYRSAGTIEGLLQDGEYFFLEMNTRVQVEHCVTEMTTGVDIVREQVLIAAGEPLGIAQEDVRLQGHAIECRINAEDAAAGFAPSPGRIGSWVQPSGPGVRVDAGVRAGDEVSPLYDPMVAKLIVWDTNRERATARMRRALDEFEVTGLRTLLPFHRALMATNQWRAGETCRDLIEDPAWLAGLKTSDEAVAAGEDAPEPRLERTYAVEVSGRRFDVRVIGQAGDGDGQEPAMRVGTAPGAGAPRAARRRSNGAGAASPGALLSPLQGTVLRVAVTVGEPVEEGALICVVEAMKMENEITAQRAGTVSELSVAEGGSVAVGGPIALIT